MRKRRRKAASTAGEIRLVLLAGIFAGLAYVLVPWGASDRAVAEASRSADAMLVKRSIAKSMAANPTTVRIIDGDTFHYGGEKIRIADIDTPELRGRCAYETQLAARATRRMDQLLRQGPFELRSVGRDEDRYGRKLRVVTRGGRSLGDQLVSEGLARTWTGRREPWCA
jgi:endonuclease YncB( thermonuclease family)